MIIKAHPVELSRRNIGPIVKSFVIGSEADMLCSMKARMTDAVASGRSVRSSSSLFAKRVHLLFHNVGCLADAALK